jgi:hypothetical protein
MPLPSTPPSREAVVGAVEPVPAVFDGAKVAFTLSLPVVSTEKARPNPELESNPPAKVKREGGAEPVIPSEDPKVDTVLKTEIEPVMVPTPEVATEPVILISPLESSCKNEELPPGVTPRAIKPRLPVVTALPLANAT